MDARPPRVALRAVRPDDLPAFFDHQRDPAAVRMGAVVARGRDAFDAHWQRILADPAVTVRTIVADGAVAGNVLRFPRDGLQLVGYWLGREHWGRGIATAALREFLRMEPLRPLHAHVARHNAGSLRVLAKCGFRVCGTVPAPPSAEGVDDVVLLVTTDAVG